MNDERDRGRSDRKQSVEPEGETERPAKPRDGGEAPSMDDADRANGEPGAQQGE
jgi:hypothetical protein